MKLIGETLDDSIGEAFDKCGKIIGLEYPAGPLIDKKSKNGDNTKYNLIPNVNGLNFSFSGLKTNFRRTVENGINKIEGFIEKEQDNLCASLQSTISEILLKVLLAVKETGIKNIVFGGSVSANSEIRSSFEKIKNLNVFFPKETIQQIMLQ